MNRRSFLTTASAAALATLAPHVSSGATARRTKHIVLVTSDGVRWQDVFTGIDKGLMNEKAAGMRDAGQLREKLWKPTPDERRKALMPFFWNTLATRGVVLGNVSKGSSVQVTNRYRVSYPGYSELLTGRTQDEVIKSNDRIQNPTPSFLQFLKEHEKLKPEQVAVFGSWDMFPYIAQDKPGAIFVNAGYERSPLPKNSPKADLFNRLQFDAKLPTDGARHDAFTFGLAMEYLDKQKPEHLYISFDETDDWAHAHRYDRVLDSLQFFDRALSELWNYIQQSSKYKNSTTLIVTTDHGRGSTLSDFSGHGPTVPGDEQIWAAFAGPDTPSTGEATNSAPCEQRDIAPTALALLGMDYQSYSGVTGKPISMAVRNDS